MGEGRRGLTVIVDVLEDVLHGSVVGRHDLLEEEREGCQRRKEARGGRRQNAVRQILSARSCQCQSGADGRTRGGRTRMLTMSGWKSAPLTRKKGPHSAAHFV